MSRINIAFGTRMGGGPRLDEATPFIPDTLCDQCLSIFKRDFTWSSYAPNTLTINLDIEHDCRLCTLLIFRFNKLQLNSPLNIEYYLTSRYGYFIEVHDIVFRLVGSTSRVRNIVRLGLQKMNPTRDEGGMPHMIHFETKLSSSTASSESMLQAAAWLKDCSENHKQCSEAFPKSKFLPSRLIEIRGSDPMNLSIRLRDKSRLPLEVNYATLSHCWGSSMPFKLTLENFDGCMENLPLLAISKVFRDAIRFANQSAIRYIWIDSLCIIQNSPKDWAHESSLMGSIYHHSILNIAATGFPDGESGLFVNRHPSLLIPIAVKLDNNQYLLTDPEKGSDHSQLETRKGNYYLVDTNTWKDSIDEAPLCKRGWVTQERALSVRTLHFGNQQLFWECVCRNANEAFPKGLQRGTVIQDPKVLLRPRDVDRQKRQDQLQGIRDRILEHRKQTAEFEAEMKAIRSKFRYLPASDSSSESETDLSSDKAFARQMAVVQKKSSQPAFEISESESNSSESDYGPRYSSSGRLKKRKPYRESMKQFDLTPKDFEGCDINILDDLDIKGWKRFKAQLQELGIGQDSERLAVRPLRGMTLEQNQWIPVVEIFTRSALTFTKDKLVAISGMAREISGDMNCEYLAGLWRRDLEHQLLWKVMIPHPATRKEDMRGPSWSWASVDGPVEIPEWGGYFNHGMPGDVTWVSRVDLARVRLAGKEEFGQVRSGVLHMTGRLGVFRINKDGKVPDPGSGEGSLMQAKGQIYPSWDTKEIEESFSNSHERISCWRYTQFGSDSDASVEIDPLDVFYLPVRIMDADPGGRDCEQPVLTGLLLSPTGKKGQYRRVGQFEAFERWGENELVTLTETMRILDPRLYLSRHKHGEYCISIV